MYMWNHPGRKVTSLGCWRSLVCSVTTELFGSLRTVVCHVLVSHWLGTGAPSHWDSTTHGSHCETQHQHKPNLAMRQPRAWLFQCPFIKSQSLSPCVYTYNEGCRIVHELVPRCVFRSWKCLNARAQKENHKWDSSSLLVKLIFQFGNRTPWKQTRCKGPTFTERLPCVSASGSLPYLTRFFQHGDCYVVLCLGTLFYHRRCCTPKKLGPRCDCPKSIYLLSITTLTFLPSQARRTFSPQFPTKPKF